MRRPSLPVAVTTAVVAGVLGTIYYVHDVQVREKKEMREGVLRDIRRDRLRKQQEEAAKSNAAL
ncbi:hypothetical protein SDRG_09242 [Saprolegnia diclina VS20]|uniref:Uncharacterized protein n=1 Tax=Saprolegnia diclina (strain VS20) TaxID=1156394 RepID=T0QHT1_SAPDV|nr:hypothetical protein SDRG_09242 [Saprolegnia diclina VS20]EQC33260.1 hypothetical protein SDRG_09242 [Saprolegnia diclina VS20]|eukprot:XP_008613383.1 hypothetical protein SDRG_09242 [Saprolegnia diclina VS20]